MLFQTTHFTPPPTQTLKKFSSSHRRHAANIDGFHFKFLPTNADGISLENSEYAQYYVWVMTPALILIRLRSALMDSVANVT